MRLEFIEAGEIVSTHGIKGEVKVLPWVDSPEVLCEFDRVRIDSKEYEVESCRIQKSCNLLKLVGVDTMEVAQALRGKTVQLYRDDIDEDVIFARVNSDEYDEVSEKLALDLTLSFTTKFVHNFIDFLEGCIAKSQFDQKFLFISCSFFIFIFF